MEIEEIQKQVCIKYGAKFQRCDMSLKVGISGNIKDGVKPIHGMRVQEESGTSGWYIWAGEYSDDKDFFLPLHGKHLQDWSSLVLPFLGLPEGWRFLVDEGYEDVWKDDELELS